MTVNEMIMLSRIFLGLMIFFLIIAMVVYFLFEVKRAWRILHGKQVSGRHKKDEPTRIVIQNNKTNELLENERLTRKIAMDAIEATALLQESTNNQYEGYDSTTVLGSIGTETTVLTNQNDNGDDIVMDITFIHTEVTL